MTDKNKICATAAQVLRQEGEALVRTVTDLPDDFVAAVERNLVIKGRIILLGIGKSGPIARKIASTLASTDTPAYFVHPAKPLVTLSDRDGTEKSLIQRALGKLRWR